MSHVESDDDKLLARHLADEENLCPLCSKGVYPKEIPFISEGAKKAEIEWNRTSRVP